MDNIVVLGNGFLGRRIADSFGVPLITDRIVDRHTLSEALRNHGGVNVVINCIGKTGSPNIDALEKEKASTYFSNTHVPYLLAEFFKGSSTKIVHISSGCVYQGDNDGMGWQETDKPNFTGSFYSFSKAAAERILEAYPNVLTLRIRMPVDSVPGPRELIGKLLRYEKIINTENSITVVQDFLGALHKLINIDATGVWNITNPEPVTHKQILDIYEMVSGKRLNKTYIGADKLVTDAPRSNCVLNTDKLQSVYNMRPTVDALWDALERYVLNEEK